MLPPDPHSVLAIQAVTCTGDTVVLKATGRATRARCPSCSGGSTQVHDRYQRRPLDLPLRQAQQLS